MKAVWKGLIQSVGVDWLIRIAVVSGLEALKDAVMESDTQWDDRIVLPVIDALAAKLKGEDPAPVLDAAKPAFETALGVQKG